MRINLLIVDDEEAARSAIAEQLARDAFEVSTAPGGEDALESIRREDFDVVILDVLMPGLNGIETLERIKQVCPLTQVILLTGHADLHAAAEGLAKGAFDYVLKPAETEELVGKIEAACEERQASKHLKSAQ